MAHDFYYENALKMILTVEMRWKLYDFKITYNDNDSTEQYIRNVLGINGKFFFYITSRMIVPIFKNSPSYKYNMSITN